MYLLMYKYSFIIKFEEIILLDQDLILDLLLCVLLLSFQDDNYGYINKEIYIQYLLYYKNFEIFSFLCDFVLFYLCGFFKDFYIGGGFFYVLSFY